MPKLSRTTTVIITLAVAGAAYAGYTHFSAPIEPVKYVLAAATKGTLVSSVTGTGQVSVTNMVDLKPKASGTIISLMVKEGQRVKAGAVIARIDASDAVKAVRDAETSLETAKLSLERLMRPPEELSTLQAQNAVIDAKAAKVDAETALQNAYDNGFNDVTDAFLDLPAVMTGMHDILFGSDFSEGSWNIDGYSDAVRQYFPDVQAYHDDADVKYRAAREQYDLVFAQYKVLSRSSDRALIEGLILDTADLAESVAEALKSADNLIRYYSDKTTERGIVPKPIAGTHLSKIAGFMGTANGHLSSLTSVRQSIANAKESIVKAERNIVERELSFEDFNAGPDDFDVRSQEITIAERETALANANAKLADYSARAPFDGVVVDVAVTVGDEVSTGTVLATVITEMKTAVISLNEVDASAVKAGQKATFTFDAVVDLSLSGTIASVDAIGAVSQGVVSYSTVIAFDADDERVKPGMSVSAAIVIDVRTDALFVPSGSVKYLGDEAYVLVPESSDGLSLETAAVSTGIELPVAPVMQGVTVGITDGVSTEILGGLAEGDLVILRTLQPSATATGAGSTQSIIPGATGGNATRFQGGGAGGNAGFIRN